MTRDSVADLPYDRKTPFQQGPWRSIFPTRVSWYKPKYDVMGPLMSKDMVKVGKFMVLLHRRRMYIMLELVHMVPLTIQVTQQPLENYGSNNVKLTVTLRVHIMGGCQNSLKPFRPDLNRNKSGLDLA
jgi:hypothetical protein